MKTAMPSVSATAIRAMLLRFAAEHEGKTFCPSEVARSLTDDWRPLMPSIREGGAHLVAKGQLRCTQRGQSCDTIFHK